MLYNKNRFQKANDKKVLHKVKKQWVTISLAILMAVGGGAVATQIDASANSADRDALASRAQHDIDQQGNNHAPNEVKTNVDKANVQMSPAKVQTQVGRSASVVVAGSNVSKINKDSLTSSDCISKIKTDSSDLGNYSTSFHSANNLVSSVTSATSSDSTEIATLSNQNKNQYNGNLTSENSVAQSVSNTFNDLLTSINDDHTSINSMISYANSVSDAIDKDVSNHNTGTSLSIEWNIMNTDVASASSIVFGMSTIIDKANSGMSAVSSADVDANQLPAVGVIKDISDHASNAASYSAEVSSVSNELASLSQAVTTSYGLVTQVSLKNAINAYGNSSADQSLVSYLITVNSLNNALDGYNASSAAGFSSVSRAASDAKNQLNVASRAISQGNLSAAVDNAAQANSDNSAASVINTIDELYQSTASQLSSEDANTGQLLASLSQSADDNGAFPVDKYTSMIANAARSVDQMSNEISSAASKISLNLSTLSLMSNSVSSEHNAALNKLYQSYISDFSASNTVASKQESIVRSVSNLISDESFYASEAVSYTAKKLQATSLDNSFASSADSATRSAEKIASWAVISGDQAASQTDSDLNNLDINDNSLDPSVASSQAIQDSQACNQDSLMASSASHAVLSNDAQIDSDSSAISSLGKIINRSNNGSADSAVNSYTADASLTSQSVANTKSIASLASYIVSVASALTSSDASVAVSAAQKNESVSASEYAQSANLSRKVANSAANSGSSLVAQTSQACKQVADDLSRIQEITNPQQDNKNLINPEQLSTTDLNNAISGLQSGDQTGIITLITSSVSNPRYVINFHPGERIRITPEDDKSIDKAEDVPIRQSADGVLYAFDDHGNKITQFYHYGSDRTLPSLDDIKRNYTVHPRMQFWFDNGDGTRTLVQNGDSGVSFQVDSNGEIVNPQTISGHYDEPHDITMQSITGGLYPSLYPHFKTETKVFRTDAQGNRVMDVVFGKGQGDVNVPTNDDTNYWLARNWTVPMIARRYFTHVIYTYNNQRYDFNNYQNGFKGDQIQDINGALQQAKAAHRINSNLNIDPNYQIPNFSLQNSGSRSNPGTVRVPLVTNIRADVQMPVLLRDVNDRGHDDIINDNNEGATDSNSAYLSTINLHNIMYDRNNPYYINKNNINIPYLSQDQQNYIKNTYGKYLDHNDPNSLLKHSFLVSGGQLNTTSEIGGPDDPEVVKSHWTDLNQAGSGIQDSYSGNGIKANNIGSYTLTQNDVNSLKRNDHNWGSNQPYVGEKIPVLYFDQFHSGGRQTDLISIPYVHYNYRFWEPLDYTQDSVYDRNFVDRGHNGYLSSGINDTNTDINNNGSADKPNDDSHNAYNFWTWPNQSLTSVSGNLAPDGFIAGINSWNIRDHYNVGSSNNPANNWYLMFTNGQNSQSVQIHYLKGTPQGLEVSDHDKAAFYNNNSNDSYHYVSDLGVADGYSNNNGMTQSVNLAKSGQYPTVSVTYNGQTHSFPKNATILADQGGLCHYVQNDHQGTYEYSNGDPIHLVEDTQPINYQGNSQNNNSYYLGAMNAYAQPMSYTVQFSGSGNYSSGGKVTQDNQEVNNYWMYPNFKDSSNDNSYSAGSNAPFAIRAYAGDKIEFIPNDSSDASQGSFYLIHNGNGYPQRLPLQIPDYQLNPKEDQVTQNNQKQHHQLFYDRQAENTFLDQNAVNEANGQSQLSYRDKGNPEWTIDPYDPDDQIWPNGYPKNHNSVAVVYLYDQEESYDNLIHFMNMDTGTALNVKYNNDTNSNSAINTLFQNNKFDMSSFLWNQVQNEKGSFLKKDGSWKLSMPLNGGRYKSYYIIRTDAPGEPSRGTVNNTYIYVASQDYNDPNVQAVLPVTIQYVDQNGQHISPIGNDQGAHDFTTYGYLHGSNGSSLDNAIKNKIIKQSGNSIQGNSLINQTQDHLWDYRNAGYHEVGRLLGNYQSDYTLPNDHPDDDADSLLFNDTKPITSVDGDNQSVQKSVFGSYPIVTIILEKNPGQNNFQIDYIDEDDPHRQNSNVASDLAGLDGYASGTSTAASTASAVTASGSVLTGSSLSSALQSLSGKGYELDYYVDNLQDSGASSSSANSISNLENNENNFKDNGQTIDVYLKHRIISSDVTSSASFNERINYQLENASGSTIGSLSAYPGSGASNGSLTFKYQQDLDLVTNRGSGQWHSAGSLSNIVSPDNGVYNASETKYYADSLSVAAPSVSISGMSLSANANGVSGVSSASSSNNLTYTYNVIYRPAVPSALAKTFNETVHYIVHSNGSAAPSVPSDYSSAETFSQKNTYNPWTHQLISAGAWQPQSGSFTDQLTSSLSGYQADVSKVAAPSADVMSPNGNANHGQTFSYVVNYYPTHEAKTVTEEISYYLHGKVFNSYQHKVQYNRSLDWSKDHTSPSYTSWSANASDFRDIPTPSVPGYRADKLMINRPDVSQDDINQDFPYHVVYYPKLPASAGDDGNGGHSQPAKPSSSSSSNQPDRPVNPINPDQPVNPSQPNSQPNQPVGPSGSNGSHSAASDSVKPSQPGSSSQPSKPSTPANSQSNRPNRPSQPSPGQPSQPVNPWPSLPTNPVSPSNSDQASSNHSNQPSNGSSADHNSVVDNPDHNGNNHVNLFSNSASLKRSAGSNSDRYANQTSRHAIKNHRDSMDARHHASEQRHAAKYNGTKSDHQKLTARRAHGVSHHAKRASHTNAIHKHRSVRNHRNVIAKRSNYGRHSRSVKRSSTRSNRHRSIVRQQRKSNRKVGVGRHQARPNRHSVRSQIHRFVRRTHRVIRRVAHQSNRSSRRVLKLHRKVRKAVQSRHYDHADSNRLQETIRREAKILGMSSSKLEQLHKTNYHRYRKLLEAHASALFNHENGDQSRRSGRQYVHGIDDARRGRQFHNYSRDYAAGYNAFQQVTGRRTGRNDCNPNGKLPQTSDGSQMTLAAAVIMILSFFLGTSAAVGKRRKH